MPKHLFLLPLVPLPILAENPLQKDSTKEGSTIEQQQLLRILQRLRKRPTAVATKSRPNQAFSARLRGSFLADRAKADFPVGHWQTLHANLQYQQLEPTKISLLQLFSRFGTFPV